MGKRTCQALFEKKSKFVEIYEFFWKRTKIPTFEFSTIVFHRLCKTIEFIRKKGEYYTHTPLGKLDFACFFVDNPVEFVEKLPKKADVENPKRELRVWKN